MPPQPTQPDLIYQCTLEQFDIGWFNFLLGRIAKHWSLAQDAHYKSLGKRRTGQFWAKGLIVELWTINWNIWEHRNTRKHTEDTPEAQATLEDLKEQVRQEFRIGPAGMSSVCFRVFLCSQMFQLIVQSSTMRPFAQDRPVRRFPKLL